MMPTFSSLVALQIVIMTTGSASSAFKVGIMMTLSLKCMLEIFSYYIKHYFWIIDINFPNLLNKEIKMLFITSLQCINYCQTPNISHTLVGNKLVDHSDVVGA